MRARAVIWGIVACWSITVGHVAWYAWLGPAVTPDYVIGGLVPTLSGTDPTARQLYLRRCYYLPQRPRAAWIQVIGHDEIHLYVNGSLVGERSSDGFPVAIVADLAPYLDVGKNVVAIVARQWSLNTPPLVAVDGAYALSDGEHPLRSDDLWRCNTTFERRATWWFAHEFMDRLWPFARLGRQKLRALVQSPPRAVMAADSGRWMTPAAWDGRSAAVRRDFFLAGRPRQAWLRVTATSSYRLALNGILLDEQEAQSGTTVPVPVVRRTYDITPTIHRGANRLSLLLMSNAGPPHVRVDAEVEDSNGHRLRLETDEQWVGHAGLPSDWLEPNGGASSAQLPCVVEVGDLDIPPWEPRRATVAVEIPPDEAARRIAGQLAVILGLAAVTLLGCRLAARALAVAGEGRPDRIPIVYLPLVPAILAIACGLVATYDPRIARQEVYQTEWVLLALTSVPLQWGLLACAWSKPPVLRWCRRIARNPGGQERRPTASLPHAGQIAHGRRFGMPNPVVEARMPGRRRRLAMVGLVLGLILVGSWLRLRHIAAEPLHTDELNVLRSALGLLERGFPSMIIHKDLPTYYICGCELEVVGPALMSLISRNECYVSRFPWACWSIATIPLIYWVGRRLFRPGVGLIAAGLYTFAATPIQMANFGRYPSQLQFFTLLTVFYYWRTIQGTGRVDRRALALTTASFLGMYFTWEASALIAPGMILAALVQRRRSVFALLVDPAVWAALLVVLAAILLQFGHGAFQQAKYLMYGTGWADVKITPMWRYPFFDLGRPVWETSWSQDAFIQAVGLLGAVLAAARSSYRRPVRVLLLILLTNCFLMAALLPMAAQRYRYHLIPLSILLVSAVCAIAARELAALAVRSGGPSWWRSYARGVVALPSLALVGLGNGVTLQLVEMAAFRHEGWLLQPGVFKLVNIGGPTKFLHEHIREGDVVIATHPDVVDLYMAYHERRSFHSSWTTDFWLQSTLDYPVMLDEHRALGRHRFCGTTMLPTREDVEDLFARHPRIWFIVQPDRLSATNTTAVSEYIRQNMDVVYEDHQSQVLFRGGNSRSAAQRLQDDQILKSAHANYLP